MNDSVHIGAARDCTTWQSRYCAMSHNVKATADELSVPSNSSITLKLQFHSREFRLLTSQANVCFLFFVCLVVVVFVFVVVVVVFFWGGCFFFFAAYVKATV